MSISNRERVNKQLDSWLLRPHRPTGSTDVFELPAVILTDIGLVRKENQDRAIVARLRSGAIEGATTLYIVCDGIGGSANGGECADLCVREVVAAICSSVQSDPQERLKEALLVANQTVYSRFGGRSGTTIVAVLRIRDTVVAASAGDSKIFVLGARGFDQISIDDTVGGELSRLNLPATHLIPHNVLSRALAQYIGMGDGLEPRSYVLDLQSLQKVALCSDGVTKLPPSLMNDLYRASGTSSAFASRLNMFSKWTGGSDNVTVVIADFTQAPSSETDFGDYLHIEAWDAFGKLDIISDLDPRQTDPLKVDEPRRFRIRGKRIVNRDLEKPNEEVAKPSDDEARSQRLFHIELSDGSVATLRPASELSRPQSSQVLSEQSQAPLSSGTEQVLTATEEQRR